jgi:DNA-directed RNA polymerase alpha subunit
VSAVTHLVRHLEEKKIASLENIGLTQTMISRLKLGNKLSTIDLLSSTENELRKIPYFGRGHLNEVKFRLAEHGLTLDMFSYKRFYEEVRCW